MRPSTAFSQGLRACNSLLPRAVPRTASRPFSQLVNRSPLPSTHISRPQRLPILHHAIIRNNSSSPLTDRPDQASTDAQNEEQNRLRREQEPAYQITFTCKPCGNRSSHRMSKHGYHRGTVLIRCPSCDNRHVISDHLNIFFDKKSTLEDILAKEGQKLTRGYLNGDMEFWDDGSVTPKEKAEEQKPDEGKGQLP
ncbi:hypothetical protein ASPWEDRAFT_177060 [Aspergillus wentii DTO 134E9]|uniref:DNL-type domain-containing protein n=1 Tax=Aspergillus wentii DTO 134E9 TaxID=1073089 RepID=A0A1L9R663_ASPWE|nr:uncharacterized protein ASPWEDRAFT_177060 [Aspergillus wentii DTO 134E9]KAI9926924.1 hypothetical protein MW887_004023 [Aspergillus wentii]OJJ30404.1 hypothetical protein ASPWEDRAFT_177060 [Aspergillus wentii DTO 134E9]